MKSIKVRNLIEKLTELHAIENNWLDDINLEIRSAFFDNTYCNSILKERDIALDFALGDLWEDVSWFLSDWKPGYKISCCKPFVPQETIYIINDLDDYMKYLEAEKLVDI